MPTAKLKKYQSMRDFTKTAEPRGAVPRHDDDVLNFTVQKHAARRLHYDFRLEIDGVLKSWAVPKGPCLDPSEKRLAVHVEDHPMEYGDFEGTIPKGEYGAGSVVLWDQGTWEPIGDPEKGYKSGKLKFKLRGKKLHGGWTLVRMHGERSDGGKNWLLIKEKDDDAVPLEVEDIVATQPGSVKARKATPKGPKSKQPTTFKPQLATLVDKVPDGDDWIHEIKYDGYRLIAIKSGNNVRLLTRSGLNWADKLPRLVRQVADLPVDSLIMDGELVVLDAAGLSDFQLLQNSFKLKPHPNMHFFAFDMPHCEGHDLTESPLIERKELLAEVLKQAGDVDDAMISYSDHLEGNGPAFFDKSCERGLEGIISKDRYSTYTGARTRDWLKVKCDHRQEFVIGGFSKPEGSRTGFGSLLLGYYDGKKLIYCGRVGTGFSMATLTSLTKQLKALEQDESPFDPGPVGAERLGVHWVKPELVGEVRFSGWTGDKRLRHPAFLGLRIDKPASEAVLEKPVKKADVEAKRPRKKITVTGKRPREAGGDAFGVAMTNPERILYPDQGYTKRDLAAYYSAVADEMLPYVANRPLSLVRCPRGSGEKCFFQKHFADALPDELQSVAIKETSTSGDYIVLNSAAGLMRLVQLGVLEMHPWGSKADDVERPDFMVFDLDPGPGVTMKALVDAARLVRQYLIELKLKSFVKTTGGKGLHVVVPIKPELSWDEIKEFTKSLAEMIVRDHPNHYVAKMTKKLRDKKIFIDYLRNGRGATSIAAFSTRARDGATVSFPISWDQLADDLDPQSFTIKTVPKLLAKRRADPWKDFLSIEQGIDPKIQELLISHQ